MLEKYYRFERVAGINININTGGEATYNVCVVKIDGKELLIESKYLNISDVNELKKIIPSATPSALNITGKGVLVKHASFDPQKPVDVPTIFPNINISEFYLQTFTSGNNAFAAVIRIAEAEKWLNKFQNLGLDIVNLSLGPFAVGKIIDQLNVYGSELVFNGHVISINDQNEFLSYKFIEGKRSQFVVKIENEKIDEELIITYADAFQLYLYPLIDLVRTDVPLLKKRLDDKIETKKVKVRGTVILTAIFLLLLFNLWLLSYYNSANVVLATQVGQTETDANKSQALSDSIKQKKALLDTLGWEGKFYKSILIDDIAQVLPTEIKWEQVVVDPLYTVAGSGNIQRFANHQIKISGVSEKLIPVNEWLARLKTLTWVKGARLQNYLFNNEKNTGEFTILINY